MSFRGSNSVDIFVSSHREALHLAPVVHALKNDESFTVRVITVAPRDEDLRLILGSLNVASDVHWRVVGTDETSTLYSNEILLLLSELWTASQPHWLVCFGNERLTFSGVFCAFQSHLRIAHVTDDNTTPGFFAHDRCSNQIRKSINALANIHFTSNLWLKNHLVGEGIDERSVYSVGSTLSELGRIYSDHFFSSSSADRSIPVQLRDLLAQRSREKFVVIEISHPNSQRELGELFIERIVDAVLGRRLIILVNDRQQRRELEGIASRFAERVFLLPADNHLHRCFLYKRACCVVSDSIETLEEFAAFRAHGILLYPHTERHDLISSGWIRFASAYDDDFVKQLAEVAFAEKESTAPGEQTRKKVGIHSGASQRIAEALTNQTNESVQK